jgi:hypothetical protein
VGDIEAFVLGFDTGLAPVVGQQATLDAGGAAEPLVDAATLRAAAAAPGQALTFTCVPPGSGWRMGVDRDGDGCLDGDDGAPGDAAAGCAAAT